MLTSLKFLPLEANIMWELENGQLEKKDDIRLKSKITQAIKLFSEGKNLIDVVIADEVQEIYRQFLKLKDMHELVEVYDEMQSS